MADFKFEIGELVQYNWGAPGQPIRRGIILHRHWYINANTYSVMEDRSGLRYDFFEESLSKYDAFTYLHNERLKQAGNWLND